MTDAPCPQCGEAVKRTQFTPNKKFCSSRCADLAHGVLRGGGLQTTFCTFCGKLFQPEHSLTTHCSPHCAQEHKNRRRRR